MKVDLIEDSDFPPTEDADLKKIAQVADIIASLPPEKALSQLANMLGSYAANFEVQTGGKVQLLDYIHEMVSASYKYHRDAVKQILNPKGDA